MKSQHLRLVRRCCPRAEASRHVATATNINKALDVSSARPFNAIPQPPRLPLFGHTYLYRGIGPYRIERYHEALKSLHAKYGPVVRQQLQGCAQGTVVHLFDAEDIRAVMEVASTTPLVPPIQEGSRLYRLAKNHAVGLGNMNGEEWRTLRRGAQVALLQSRRVEQQIPNTERSVQNLLAALQTSRGQYGKVFDLYFLLARWFLDTAGQVLYEKFLGGLVGSDLARDEAGQWIQANIDIFTLNAELKVASPLFKIFPIKPWRELVRAEDTFYRLSAHYLQIALREVRALTDADKLEGQYSLLTQLLAREEITRKDLVFFINSMVSDGLATVPSTMLSAIHCLSHSPEVQEKAYQEVKKSLDTYEPITPQAIENMPYIKAIVKETFRMFPLGTEVSRILPKDMVLGGYHVPAGSVVDLNHSCSVLKNEKYFPEPLKFRPERWMRGDPEATQHAAMLTPFGHGPRMCVGRRISQQTMYIGLARILQKFELVSPVNDLPYGQVYRTLLFPDRDLNTRFLTRD